MVERAMTCREASNLLPLFFDGELDAHQMRAVALHSTRCGGCEDELRRMERVQEVISAHVTAAVDEVDFGALWRGIDERLGTAHVSWWTRARAWWSEGERGWVIKVPAFAAAAAGSAARVLAVDPHAADDAAGCVASGQRGQCRVDRVAG